MYYEQYIKKILGWGGATVFFNMLILKLREAYLGLLLGNPLIKICSIVLLKICITNLHRKLAENWFGA
jgi:hypothetical protein